MIKTYALLLLSFLLSAACFPAGAESSGESSPDAVPLSLLAVNVGKADALLLRSGATIYLVDTGTKKSFEDLYAVLSAEGITRLDGVILTHTHSDHAGGLKQLLASDIQVDQVYASAFYDKEEKKHPAVKALKGTGREVVFLAAGNSLPLDGGTLEVLGPRVKNENAENCNSLVLLASGGGGTMLLTGDMEFPEEADLLSAGLLSPVDVLKVGNHGEGDATSDAFIAAVQPRVAVISTNTPDEPDTPDPRVMQLLSRWNVAVYQTQDASAGVQITLHNGEILTEIK